MNGISPREDGVVGEANQQNEVGVCSCLNTKVSYVWNCIKPLLECVFVFGKNVLTQLIRVFIPKMSPDSEFAHLVEGVSLNFMSIQQEILAFISANREQFSSDSLKESARKLVGASKNKLVKTISDEINSKRNDLSSERKEAIAEKIADICIEICLDLMIKSSDSRGMWPLFAFKIEGEEVSIFVRRSGSFEVKLYDPKIEGGQWSSLSCQKDFKQDQYTFLISNLGEG